MFYDTLCYNFLTTPTDLFVSGCVHGVCAISTAIWIAFRGTDLFVSGCVHGVCAISTAIWIAFRDRSAVMIQNVHIWWSVCLHACVSMHSVLVCITIDHVWC